MSKNALYKRTNGVMKKSMFTQAQVSSLLDCSQASVSQWCQGNAPSNKNILKIKEILKYLKLLTRETVDKQRKCEVIRNKFGLTATKVALFIEVTPSTIYRWEKGEIPKVSSLTRIKQGVKSIKSILPAECDFTKVA